MILDNKYIIRIPGIKLFYKGTQERVYWLVLFGNYFRIKKWSFNLFPTVTRFGKLENKLKRQECIVDKCILGCKKISECKKEGCFNRKIGLDNRVDY